MSELAGSLLDAATELSGLTGAIASEFNSRKPDHSEIATA